MWQKVQFIVANLREIRLTSMWFWIMLVLTVQLLGLIDIEARCPPCGRVFDKVMELVISDANATGNPLHLPMHDNASFTISLSVLPKLEDYRSSVSVAFLPKRL
jgi:hypothetical protein